MNGTSQELRALLDRENIRACAVRLARGEDRRDPKLIGGCYWPEATTDFGIFAGSLDEYLAWVVPGSPAVLVTQHVLGQTLVELRGDAASAETFVTSYHRMDLGTEQRDVTIGGRYLDRFERRDGEWRIAHRTMLYDWLRDYGVSVDWTQGVMGTPFSGGHYTGRVRGDHSETFFGAP